MLKYDAIVIGAGQAGPPLAVRLADAGQRVALVERNTLGGTCVNNGCTPTKTMIASAYAARVAHRAAEYGIDVAGTIAADMKRVKARKDAVVQRSVESLTRWIASKSNVTFYRDRARFAGPHDVRVGSETLSAPRIFINVGGRPLVPALDGIDQVRYLTSETMMDVDWLPEHLLIVGGSYIGLEFGQMFRRFGSRVTIIEMGSRLIGREDPDISALVQQVLEAEGIEFRLAAKCLAIERDGDRVAAQVHCEEGAPKVSGTDLLLAVGRVPNTDDLGLEDAGIDIDEQGYIKVDDRLETTRPGVFALGDCNGRGAFTHTAYNDYEIVADNLLAGAARKVTDRLPIYALFIDPPLGRAGMTEADAQRAGIRYTIGTRPMRRVMRAVEKGEADGVMKVIVDTATQRVVGAAILGVGGDEAVHSLIDAMYAGLPSTAVAHGVRIHPTVSELIPTVLGELEPPGAR